MFDGGRLSFMMGVAAQPHSNLCPLLNNMWIGQSENCSPEVCCTVSISVGQDVQECPSWSWGQLPASQDPNASNNREKLKFVLAELDMHVVLDHSFTVGDGALC